ncbi:MAG: UDP-N-acetylmuramoyl-tripeptide--D-alanyl-D-alanine ligase [Anaerolineae bacterium]|jgi:UDP-N-acetylmuramoyl-tripeptide--D-alanyl-D-alanine ligase
MQPRTGRLTLRHLVAALAPPQVRAQAASVPEAEIRTTVVDSRRAGPGSLFVALQGERHDGHDFIPHALDRGAVAIIAQRAPAGSGCVTLSLVGETPGAGPLPDRAPLCLIVPDSLAALQQAAAYWRRQHDVRVIGITGSIGKTTSKEIVAAILSQRYHTLKNEGNYNNEIGLPLTLLHLRDEHERVVLEMGMYDLGEIAQLAEIARPQVGLVTNVGPSHLERLGTIERIARAKAELPQALPPAAEGGVVILNADDQRVRAMSAQTSAQVFYYGLKAGADLWASDIESEGLEGIRFRFHYQHETIHAQLPLLGRHSVHTALRGAAVGLVEGLDWTEIMSGLRDQSAQLRLVAVPGPQDSTILDDTYNSSPASCIAALNLLAELPAQQPSARKVAVLGDMYELGDFEQEGHRIVGRRVKDTTDLLVAVGRLGRIIGQEALESGMAPEAVHMVEDNARAIELLRGLVQPGDQLLIKGSRGMEMEEIVVALQKGDLP